ncbi:hypothetical protein AVEN_137007-1 [Araneus ventricosus]|uniref:Uncharacterized protein n=1 Tax=Araneus ventricosus TaxID=182803 RepID=A0A4Y2R4V8_ARAVE|nr:hypothetical protein AVEN_137007-1 [Araneus ventricosus]
MDPISTAFVGLPCIRSSSRSPAPSFSIEIRKALHPYREERYRLPAQHGSISDSLLLHETLTSRYVIEVSCTPPFQSPAPPPFSVEIRKTLHPIGKNLDTVNPLDQFRLAFLLYARRHLDTSSKVSAPPPFSIEIEKTLHPIGKNCITVSQPNHWINFDSFYFHAARSIPRYVIKVSLPPSISVNQKKLCIPHRKNLDTFPAPPLDLDFDGFCACMKLKLRMSGLRTPSFFGMKKTPATYEEEPC